jgi:hypothetical protein
MSNVHYQYADGYLKSTYRDFLKQKLLPLEVILSSIFFCYNHIGKYNYFLFANVELGLRHINMAKNTPLMTIRAGSQAPG